MVARRGAVWLFVRAMKASFPDRVTVVMVPEAGHAMLPEQPDIIENALLSFLSKIQEEGVK